MSETVLLGVGALAGLLAGLLGIGGGIVLVPALIFLFESQNVSPEIATQLAVGTSLASILFTGSASAWAHHRRNAVDWRIVGAMAPFIVIGTQIGALLAGAMHGITLKRLFGLFELLVAARMLRAPQPDPRGRAIPPFPLYSLGGLVIGIVSSLFGIGGGTLTVPLLVYLLGRSIRSAVGTASAQGVVIAVFGTAGFVYQGWGKAALPPGAWGFVLPSAALFIALPSVAFAPVGALLAHRVRPATLGRAFGVLLIWVGLRLSGLF